MDDSSENLQQPGEIPQGMSIVKRTWKQTSIIQF